MWVSSLTSVAVLRLGFEARRRSRATGCGRSARRRCRRSRTSRSRARADRAARRSSSRAHREARVLASQLPDDLAGLGVEVVGGPGVARGDQQAPVLVEVDRVDVEVVEREGRVAGARGRVGFGERDVVEARPLVHHQPRPHVDLLEGPVGHGAVGRAADAREVAVDRVIRGDQRRALRRQLELVQVGLQPVPGPARARSARRRRRGSRLRPARTRAPRCRPATTSAPVCRRIPARAGWSPRCTSAAL